MIADAEAHANEDRERREEAEARNSADSLIYQTEKMIRDNEDKITDDEKTDVEEKIASLKGLLEDEGASLDDLKEAVESLNTASQGFAQRLYEAAAQQESTDEADDMDDIIDAEIIDEEEETCAKMKKPSPRMR